MDFIIKDKSGDYDESLARAIIESGDKLERMGANPAAVRITASQYMRLKEEAPELTPFEQAIECPPTFNGMRIEVVPDPDQIGRGPRGG